MMKKLTALLLALAMLLGVTTAFAWNCPNCGNEMGGKFCTECGTKKPADVICPNCGTNYGESGPKFCMECGTKLSEAALAATATPTATPAPTAAPTATPTVTPAPTAEPEEEKASEVIMYPNDGRLSLIWDAEVGMEYRIHFFPKWHDSIEEDRTEWNLSFGLEYKSTLGVFTINHMPAGQAFWVGVFDAEGNGEYMPYNPELPVPAFTDCEAEVSAQQMIRRDGMDDVQVDAFTLADLKSGSGITPGMYLACFYNNPGEAIETFVQVVIEAPTGDKYVSSVNNITMKAKTEDGFGWSFYSLAGNFTVMENIYGAIPTGDYLVSMYLNGKHAGTTSFTVVEEAAATATPAPTATPKPTEAPKAAAALKITGVVNQGDGTYLLTWEDNGNGPWYVNFVEHWSDDFVADTNDARSSAYWSDASELTETRHILKYLVPGMSYWIEVEDSKGNAAQLVYNAPYNGKSTRNAWIEAWPRVQNGEAYTDLAAFSVENVNNGNCGLYLQINYAPVSAETQKTTQMVLTLPDGVTFCTSTFDMNMFPGGDTYWELWNLDWEFGRVKAWNDSILLGEYKLDVYIEGKYAASTVFEVTEEGAAAVSDDALYGVEIVSVTENADGTATVTWTDANNNGPYEIDYVQKNSDDYDADRSTGTGWWYDTKEAAGFTYTMRYLVPGQPYWIAVYDADGNGQYVDYCPAAAQNFPEFPMEMELSLVWRLGEDADLTVNEFSSAEIAADMADHGLQLWIAHPQLARTRNYLGVIAITSPDGSRVADNVSDWQLDQGEAKSVGWSFYDLEWYFGIMTKNFGAVPVGDYTVEFFCDGEFVCNGTFSVIN